MLPEARRRLNRSGRDGPEVELRGPPSLRPFGKLRRGQAQGSLPRGAGEEAGGLGDIYIMCNKVHQKCNSFDGWRGLYILCASKWVKVGHFVAGTGAHEPPLRLDRDSAINDIIRTVVLIVKRGMIARRGEESPPCCSVEIGTAGTLWKLGKGLPQVETKRP